MEYRRRRDRSAYSGRKRETYSGRYRSVSRKRRSSAGTNAFAVLLPILAFAAAAYLLLGTELGDRLSQRAEKAAVALPSGCGGSAGKASGKNGSEKETLPEVTISTQAPEATYPLTDSIKVSLPGVTLSMLQMGVYSSEEYGMQQAESLKKVGAAGYVYNDSGSYRVIAAAYTDEGAAKNVCGRLNNEGYDCTVFPISCSGADLIITAGKDELEKISAAFGSASDSIREISAASSDFDKGERSPEYTDGKLASIAEKTASSADALKDEAAGNELLMCVCGYLKDASDTINNILSDGGAASRAEYSSRLKTLEITIILRYVTLLKQICY